LKQEKFYLSEDPMWQIQPFLIIMIGQKVPLPRPNPDQRFPIWALLKKGTRADIFCRYAGIFGKAEDFLSKKINEIL
jgi:hypothetical protein